MDSVGCSNRTMKKTKHTSKVVKEWLNQARVRVLEWSSQSRDRVDCAEVTNLCQKAI